MTPERAMLMTRFAQPEADASAAAFALRLVARTRTPADAPILALGAALAAALRLAGYRSVSASTGARGYRLCCDIAPRFAEALALADLRPVLALEGWAIVAAPAQSDGDSLYPARTPGFRLLETHRRTLTAANGARRPLDFLIFQRIT
jgi:hypothetical protein